MPTRISAPPRPWTFASSAEPRCETLDDLVAGCWTAASTTMMRNQPTSLEIKGNTAYVVTLGGEIWQINHIACPPYGGPH